MVEHALHGLDADEVEQEVRREIAARRDHVVRQLADAHHLADRGVHLGVRVPLGGHSKERSVGGAEKAVPDVESRVRRPPTFVNGGVHPGEDGDLDGARRVEPPISLVVERRSRLGVVHGNGEGARLGLALDLGKALGDAIQGLLATGARSFGDFHVHVPG